ncbi:MAG TPA: RlmE family RNA methyltransferase [Gammaproteobacteria bacterium]|jgi:23S rRNA (uridine2552-2'-O)-methyltransferase|nr:RlmE family RNA methyltransferase [Gammaproteobacteria bacterium]HIK68797.1 RlmE family RNA methyltransferase [Pseudomonadales bacterium]
MKRSKTSQRWLKQHEQDPYVKKARAEGYRSRASYKLLEINDRLNLFRPGQIIVDLGAAPGGWSQVAERCARPAGRIIALDLLEMEAIPGVEVIRGDFTTDDVYAGLQETLRGCAVDLVISDMAPNLSGMKHIDLPRSVFLVELALDFADKVLAKGGIVVTKVFEGEGIDDLRNQIRSRYTRLVNMKPKASRGRSRELYLVGIGHK